MKTEQTEISTANLDAFARSIGFHNGANALFMTAMMGKVGAFTRLAVQHGVDPQIAVAAKREFIARLSVLS